MSNSFDVIVIGGGPGGAAAAIACRQRGLRTLVLERGSEGGGADQIPGETLQPGIEILFRALGVDVPVNTAGFFRHGGHCIHSKGESRLETFGADDRGQWKGYLVDRPRLHGILIGEAVASGAAVMRGVRAVGVLQSGTRVAGVETTSGRFTSQFVVDASGGRQWMVHQLGLHQLRVSPALVARFGWVNTQHDSAANPLPNLYLHDEGWEWTAPISPSCQAWVRLGLNNARCNTRTLIPPEFSAGTSGGRPGARDVSWRIVPHSAGPGYFLVGDAAWILDPACSHGVFKAVMSAMVAAEAIARCKEPAVEREQQLGYCDWLRDWFWRDAAALITLYSRLRKPPSWLTSAAETVRTIVTSPVLRAFPSSPRQN